MSDFAPIDPVLQHQIECPAGKMLAAGQPSACSFTALTHDTHPVEFSLEQRDRAQFRMALKDQPDGRRLRANNVRRMLRPPYAVITQTARAGQPGRAFFPNRWSSLPPLPIM